MDVAFWMALEDLKQLVLKMLCLNQSLHYICENKTIEIKMKRIFSLAILFSAANFSIAYSQHALASSGNIISGNGGTVSFTVGQIDYASFDGTTGSIEQGVQHAYEIYLVSAIEVANSNFVVSIYPNPTSDIINLHVEDSRFESISYKLYGIGGKLLESNPIEAKQIQIRMAGYPADLYFIQIYKDSQHLKTFKVIKTKAE